MGKESVDYSKTDLKVLQDIPMLSVTEIKRSPMVGFNLAQSSGTGVYITNRNESVGVMLTQEQYEQLVGRLKQLERKAEFITDEA